MGSGCVSRFRINVTDCVVFEDKTVSEKHHVNAKRIGRPFYSLSTVSLPQLPERCLYLTC